MAWIRRQSHPYPGASGTASRDAGPKNLVVHRLTCGLHVGDVTGVRVNPFTRGFSLSPSMAVNYMLVAARDPDEDLTGTGR